MKRKLPVTISIFFLFLSLSLSAQDLPEFDWANQFGGTDNGMGNSIAVDASGNVYTSGTFAGTVDFDPGPNSHNLTSLGEQDAYISKLDASGNFLWAKRIGGTNDESNVFMDLDSEGNSFLIGTFEGTVDFDPGAATYNLTSTYLDVFVVKLDTSGNFVWAKQIEGSSFDQAFSVVADNSGNVYILGIFEETTDFDPGSDVFNLVSTGFSDIFICKLDNSGNFIWAKQLGGPLIELGLSIATDSAGNVYSTGFFSGVVDFDPGTGVFNLSNSNDGDIFISKLDSSGNFIWAKQLEAITPNTVNVGFNITSDPTENVYVTGYFSGETDFDPGSSIFALTSSGAQDAFICKLDPMGDFVWAKGFGGSGLETALSIYLNPDGDIYTTGMFENTVDFDPGTDTYDLTSAGNSDIFINKFDNSGNFLSAASIGGTGMDQGLSTINGSDDIYITGGFENTVDFDPGTGSFELISEGMSDIFVLKLNGDLGIVENAFSQNFQIYPNPVSSTLNISSEISEIEQIQVYDLLGRKVMEQKSDNMNMVLKLEKFVPGIYMVKIIAGGKMVSHKIIKQ